MVVVAATAARNAKARMQRLKKRGIEQVEQVKSLATVAGDPTSNADTVSAFSFRQFTKTMP